MMESKYSSRRAITMAETIVSTLLVGLVLVSTIQIIGPVVRSGSVMSDRLVASNLALELSGEIGVKMFTSPILNDVESIGAAVDESRSTYDDVDDYDGLNNTPPQDSTGSALSHLGNWTRSVQVSHVELANPKLESARYTGLKRVTVTVSKDKVQLAEIITLHSHAADQVGFVMKE